MLRNLITAALVVLSASAQAQDSSAILGKTIDILSEIKVTNGSGSEATTTVEQSTRKIRITKDGKVFFTVKSGQGGEMGSIFKLNQTVNLARSSGMMPDDAANFSFSSYLVTVTFSKGSLTQTSHLKGTRKSDKSSCVTHGSSLVAFSPDLGSCSLLRPTCQFVLSSRAYSHCALHGEFGLNFGKTY